MTTTKTTKTTYQIVHEPCLLDGYSMVPMHDGNLNTEKVNNKFLVPIGNQVLSERNDEHMSISK